MARSETSASIPLASIGDYPDDWERSTLGEACALVTDGTHDSPKASLTGFPLVTGKCITGGRVNLAAAYLISEDDHKAVIARSKPEFGDILFANIGNSIGELARVESTSEFSIKNVALFKPGPRLASKFLKYYLLSAPVQSYIRGNLYGSAQPFVGLGTLRSFPIPLPRYAEQEIIASILGALDDKINLNRRMNETLEAMARAIFNDWFVDFGPTRAKIEGRAPYLAPEIWKLFPDSLDDEGKPEGWIASTIGEEVDVVGGSTPSTGEPGYWNGDIAWTTPKDLSTLTTPILLSTERMITGAGLAQIGSGLLPVGTVFLSSRAPIGYIAVAKIPTAINQGFIGMICRKRISNVFVWLWTRANLGAILQHANGSTFQEISKKNFRPLTCLLPSPEVLKAFNEVASPLFERIASNTHEDRWLMQTRDLLLPKLMSGQIRVKDAERMAETAL